MARATPDEIRRRIAKRKQVHGSTKKTVDRQPVWPGDDDKYEFNYIPPSAGDDGDVGHPLFKKEVFFFKILASILLFLVVAILFRDQSAAFDPARNLVQKTMGQDFQFAAVSKWYEGKFGKPLALLPFTEDEKADKVEPVQKGAVEVSGKILEHFKKNGQGIMIETGKGAPVQAINDGTVTFVGLKEGLGKTVIVQHSSDNTETWYGNLSDVKVRLFEYIDKRAVVGSVSDSDGEDKSKGKYYFAVKKGDEFIDPIKVIRVE